MNIAQSSKNGILREKLNRAESYEDIVVAIIEYNQSPGFEDESARVSGIAEKKSEAIKKSYNFYFDPNYNGSSAHWSERKCDKEIGVMVFYPKKIEEFKACLDLLEDEDLWPCYSSLSSDNVENFMRLTNILLTYNLCNHKAQPLDRK